MKEDRTIEARYIDQMSEFATVRANPDSCSRFFLEGVAMDKSPEQRRIEGMHEQLLLSEKDRGVLWNENQTLRESLAASQREREQLQRDAQASADMWLKELERADTLQARVDAAEKLVIGWRETMRVCDEQGNAGMAAGYHNCAEDLAMALASTPAAPVQAEGDPL